MIRNGFDREAGSQSDLKFHAVHGSSITLTHGGFRSVRECPFSDGLVFSHRPIAINELVCIRHSEIQQGRFGPVPALHFGVTSINPSSHLQSSGALGNEALDYFEHNPCYWIANLPNRYVSQGGLVQFSVSQRGEINYKIDGVDKGIIIREIDTEFPLWVVIDVYGNAKSVEFVTSRDVRAHNADIRHPHTGIVAAAEHPPREIQQQSSPIAAAAAAEHPPPGIRQRLAPWADWLLAAWAYCCTWARAAPQAGASAEDKIDWLLPAMMFCWAWCHTSPMKGAETPQPGELPRPAPTPAHQPRRVPAADTCSICMAASVDTAVYSCGHMCMCNGCAMIIKRSGAGCPICRRPIKDILKIFKS